MICNSLNELKVIKKRTLKGLFCECTTFEGFQFFVESVLLGLLQHWRRYISGHTQNGLVMC